MQRGLGTAHRIQWPRWEAQGPGGWVALGSASVSAWGWWELQVVSEEEEAASPVMQLSLDHGWRRNPVVLENIRPVGSPPPHYALLPNAPMSPLKSFFPCN